MTPQQFTEWLAFRRIRGPFGGERQDAYALMQMALTRGAQAGPENWMYWLVEPRNPDDDPEDDRYVPSAEERAWAAAMA